MSKLIDPVTQDELASGTFDKFRSIASYYPSTDWLLVLYEDCSYRSKWLPDIGMELLYHPYEERLVGVKIVGFSSVVSPDILIALAPKMPVSFRVHYQLYLRWREMRRQLRYRWRRMTGQVVPTV